MSFDQLRYFVAVAESGTTRAAAQSLHVSQPPLSRQIRALESELEVSLFERTARGMTLLPAGQLLLKQATHILAAVEETKRLLGATGPRLATSSALSLRDGPECSAPARPVRQKPSHLA